MKNTVLCLTIFVAAASSTVSTKAAAAVSLAQRRACREDIKVNCHEKDETETRKICDVFSSGEISTAKNLYNQNLVLSCQDGLEIAHDYDLGTIDCAQGKYQDHSGGQSFKDILKVCSKDDFAVPLEI